MSQQVLKPRVRGFICITAHPEGCAAHVREQIAHVRSRPALKDGPKSVLVIGASTGYGLSSRIAAAFGSGAATLGVFFERNGEGDKPGSPGWYNTTGFHAAAKQAGLKAFSLNGDAFSAELKAQVIADIKAKMPGGEALRLRLTQGVGRIGECKAGAEHGRRVGNKVGQARQKAASGRRLPIPD